MSETSSAKNGIARQWVVSRVEPSGEFTVEVAGIPELRATAATRADAIVRVREKFREWITSGRLAAIEVPAINPLLNFPGHLAPDDPLEQEFVAELARCRQEDRDQVVREADPECPNSSSTPIT